MFNAIEPDLDYTRPATPTGQGLSASGFGRWSLVVGGSVLALYGFKQMSPARIALGAIGASIAVRGIRGFQRSRDDVSVRHERGIRVVESVTVNRSARELYQFWRELEALPSFTKHLESVEVIDETRSRWVAKGPLGRIEWDAEIINDIKDKLIAWRSVNESDVGNAGSVQFEAVPGRGTRVTVTMQYEPPGSSLTALFAKIFGEEPGQQVREDLRRFKQIVETGEIATTEGQPSGR